MTDDRIYEELGRNYRFFATWRHLTFAAGIAIDAAVLKTGSDKGLWSGAFTLACFAGALAQIILMMLDARTRAHTQAAVEQGVRLEGTTPGFFTGLNAKKTRITHTIAVRLFFGLSAAALLYLGFTR
jgi:DNA invertase Pin-like site-specific DNA recombinase